MANQKTEVRSCTGCKFQDGKYCKWWKQKDKKELPLCQFIEEKMK